MVFCSRLRVFGHRLEWDKLSCVRCIRSAYCCYRVSVHGRTCATCMTSQQIIGAGPGLTLLYRWSSKYSQTLHEHLRVNPGMATVFHISIPWWYLNCVSKFTWTKRPSHHRQYYSAIHGLNFVLIELAVPGQDGITADPYIIKVTAAELQDSRTMLNNVIVMNSHALWSNHCWSEWSLITAAQQGVITTSSFARPPHHGGDHCWQIPRPSHDGGDHC